MFKILIIKNKCNKLQYEKVKLIKSEEYNMKIIYIITEEELIFQHIFYCFKNMTKNDSK